MKKKPAKRVKHVPQRTCVGCRQVMSKRKLIRLVRTADGVQIDMTGKVSGRGAYLHENRACWEKALKGALAKALRCGLSEENRRNLDTFMETLPDEPDEE